MSAFVVPASADAGSYQRVLLGTFQERKQKNPAYSLRAFARSLGISKTALSDALAFKRNLSKKNLLKVADNVGLSPSETAAILSQVKPRAPLAAGEPVQLLPDDTFHLISDWYHYGILSLARLKNNRARPEWIARKLNITPLEARTALLRLMRLQMLKIEDGRMKRSVSKLNTSDDVVSGALKKHHRQNLQRAERALESVAPEKREFGSLTFLADPKRLPQAKRMIREFEDRVTQYLETGNATEVYSLSLQLFPAETNGAKHE
jgi:hypothetical protein